MADAKVQIGLSTDFLEGTSVNTPAGDNLFREGVVISDPEVAQARARITNVAPSADDYALAVRVIGNLTLGSEVEVKNDAGNPIPVSGSVAVSNFPATQAVSGTVSVGNFPAVQPVSDNGGSLTVDGTVAATQSGAWSVGRTWTLANATDSVNVGNFPATQAVSGTVAATQSGVWNITNITGTVSLPTGAATAAKQLPDNHQVTVSNFPANQAVSGTVTANLGTLNGAALDSSVQAINGKLPDESGVWGYNAGTAGTLNVAANKRILSISATAAALTAASMTINGGQSITIPAGTSITINPKANLTAPSLVFTATASYFVEFIE